MAEEFVEFCDADDVVGFASAYDLPLARPCSIANCRTPHNRGFIVDLKGGGQARIGHICGKNLLGVSFDTMERDLRAREEKARRQRLIQNSNFDPAGALAGLDSWRPRFDAMQTFARELDQAEILAGLKATATKMDGRLSDSGGVIHVLQGREWLRSDNGFFHTEGRASAHGAAAILKKPHPTDAEIRKALGEAARAVRLLTRLADALDSFDVFGRSDLGGLIKWLRRFRQVRVADTKLYISTGFSWMERSVEVSLPIPSTTRISRDPLRKLGFSSDGSGRINNSAA